VRNDSLKERNKIRTNGTSFSKKYAKIPVRKCDGAASVFPARLNRRQKVRNYYAIRVGGQPAGRRQPAAPSQFPSTISGDRVLPAPGRPSPAPASAAKVKTRGFHIETSVERQVGALGIGIDDREPALALYIRRAIPRRAAARRLLCRGSLKTSRRRLPA
jgi:hypothetical protein